MKLIISTLELDTDFKKNETLIIVQIKHEKDNKINVIPECFFRESLNTKDSRLSADKGRLETCRNDNTASDYKYMKKIFLYIIFIPFFISANGIQEKTESLFKSEFGGNVEITFSKFQIPVKLKNEIEVASKQRFFSENIFVWTITENDSVIALGLMDNVYGKAQPITFLTIFTLDGIVHSNHIIKYREEHGGQVANIDWNKQFVGIDKNSDVNNKVDGISGATISVNSVKKGVKKLILLFDIVKEYLSI